MHTCCCSVGSLLLSSLPFPPSPDATSLAALPVCLCPRYCLEVQKENKFLRLERMIVYLIMAELAVSLMDGHVFAAVKALLQYLGVLSP